jgi:hypothetical protein
MTVHLSALTLDEAAAGLPIKQEARAHLDTCDSCKARLARLQDERKAIITHPGYEATFHRIRSVAEHRVPERSRWRWLFGLLPAAAAVAVLLFVIRPAPHDDGERVKGAPSLTLVRPNGARVAPPLHPGERFSVYIHGAGQRYGLVMSVDDHGNVEQLWPTQGTGSGPLTSGPTSTGTFEVTAGDFTLYAFFSDEPLSAAAARDALVRARTATSSEAAEPTLPGERARVRYDVQVRSGR